MADVLVVSGAGPDRDPWHRFAETSQRLADIITDLGHSVEITEAVEQSLAAPGERDLIVINIGNPAEPRPVALVEAAECGLHDHLRRAGGLLVMHVSATSMTTMATWSEILGGHWVRGRTMHPPQDLAMINVCTGGHPVVEDLADFTVFDERYSYLHTNPDITVLCRHRTDERTHPVVWARAAGRGRVVYDGLGHDVRSFDSAGHVDLLRRSVTWLVGARGGQR